MRLAATCALLALAGLGLGACATVSPAERAAFCQTVDWHDYGRNDGLLGVPRKQRADVFAECRELGPPPDLAAYRDGRAVGLEAYCTAENGYEVGRAGRRYREVCPPGDEIAFLQGYEEGRRDRGRALRVQPHFSLGLGIGHFHSRHRWGFGHRHPFWW